LHGTGDPDVTSVGEQGALHASRGTIHPVLDNLNGSAGLWAIDRQADAQEGSAERELRLVPPDCLQQEHTGKCEGHPRQREERSRSCRSGPKPIATRSARLKPGLDPYGNSRGALMADHRITFLRQGIGRSCWRPSSSVSTL